MTRPKETELEIMTRSELLGYLRNKGHTVHNIKRSVQDKPDIALTVDGRNIACEITGVPDNKILSEVNRKGREIVPEGISELVIVWPMEQHIWIRDAIEKKVKLINSYLQAVLAHEAWLVIHPYDLKNTVFSFDRDDVLKLAKYGASISEKGFDRVFVWGQKIGIRQIYPLNQAIKAPCWDLRNGYPAEGIGVVSSTGEYPVADGVRFELDQNVICVDPKEPKFTDLKPNYVEVRKFAVKHGNKISVSI